MRQVGAVVEYQLTGFLRVWRGTVFGAVLMPVVFFLAIGVSVGMLVDGRHGVDGGYASFVGAGLAVFVGAQIGLMESGIPVFAALNWHRAFIANQYTPVSPAHVVTGQIAFITLRAAASATIFLAVMAAFGATHSPGAVLLPLIAALTAASLAGLNFAVAASARTSFQVESVTKMLTTVLLLVSGVFFPVTLLPSWLEAVTWVSPLWHAVELGRAANTGTGSTGPVLVHVGVLVACTLAGVLLATRRLTARLES
ncbi:transport permease protein [Cellulomonas chitinilytica]|uniref:Transport permease protein n=1 Tax=Cellulomonas chitinilytica TaxID=398759 RepID=A0A919NZS8_9CELL|nr:transport permease protein [Cellulomonas chitinilytica]